MTDDSYTGGSTPPTLTCADCGNEYPVGGTVGKDDSPERAEHHEDDCPVRDALEQRGQSPQPETEGSQ